jgi:cbb3-type cytochrome oxidase maturation protein
MEIIFIVLPLAIILAGFALWGFIWAAKEGQYDDLDTPPLRAMLGDDD